MPSSGYAAIVFVANEQPTTAKWNLIGSNDSAFNLGTGLEDNVILDRHILTANLKTNKFSNPYKFRVNRAAAYTTVGATNTALPFDTKDYDTGTNVDVVTNKGRFTAPIAGFYQFNGRYSCATAGYQQIYLKKNGTTITSYGGQLFYTSAQQSAVVVADCLQLAANDYIELFYYTDGAQALVVSTNGAYFAGFLVSAT